jgi:hypothetical protein
LIFLTIRVIQLLSLYLIRNSSPRVFRVCFFYKNKITPPKKYRNNRTATTV